MTRSDLILNSIWSNIIREKMNRISIQSFWPDTGQVGPRVNSFIIFFSFLYNLSIYYVSATKVQITKIKNIIGENDLWHLHRKISELALCHLTFVLNNEYLYNTFLLYHIYWIEYDQAWTKIILKYLRVKVDMRYLVPGLQLLIKFSYVLFNVENLKMF